MSGDCHRSLTTIVIGTGALLGALLGASKGMAAFPRHLIDGLVGKDQIGERS
jgi:ADP-ribosylglycohydrolase